MSKMMSQLVFKAFCASISRFSLVFALAFCAASAAVAAETVSWSLGCDDADEIESYVATNSIVNAILCSSVRTSNMALEIEDNTKSDQTKSGEKYLKMTPNTSGSLHYATVSLPSSVTGTHYADEGWTFSFDYAPERGSNNQDSTNYGLAVHDTDGNALFTCKGHQQSSFTIYIGANSSSDIGTIALDQITARGSSDKDSKIANWFRITLTGTSSGVSLAITNLQSNAEIALSDNVLCTSHVVPSKVLIMTGNYAGRPQWALVDDFSFTGKTIYKDKYTQTVDYDFEDDGDNGILENGYVDNAILGTSAATIESTPWSRVTGEVSPKGGEGFVMASVNGVSTSYASRTGYIANMPTSLRNATEYVLEFDALIEQSAQGVATNGIAIVGKNGAIVTIWAGDGKTQVCRGESLEDDDILVSGFSVTARTTNPQTAENCTWHHIVLRGDAEGLWLTMGDLSTGVAALRDKYIGSYDTVAQIAFVLAMSNSARTAYAAIDNIRAYTYGRKGFMIIIE